MFGWLKRNKAMQSVGGGWRPVIHEPFTGAWQMNRELRREEVGSFFAVFACASKIAQDVSKLQWRAVRRDGIGKVLDYLPVGYEVLKRPNHYQNPQQFLECWVQSKLFRGNAYIYLDKDFSGSLKAMYVLNPDLVKPLVDDDGSVYYELAAEKLNRTARQVIPAEFILHDRWNCFYHPLVGLPPVMACNIAAANGLSIQKSSWSFFGNKARPAGILTAPGHIDKDKAAELAKQWNQAYSGDNAGKTAVLSDSMQFQAITMSAAESELIGQLRLSAEIVCSAFKVPPFLIGFGGIPAGMKVSDLNELYYSSCLQTIIEAIENLLSDTLPQHKVAVEFDLDALIRMDAFTQIEVLKTGVGSALITPNEARAKLGYEPVVGGDSPYLQQQNFSLAALAKRDAQADPFGGQPTGDGQDG